ncbi:MAG: nucleotidyltransferase family protein [Clostridia bacterium]|nr:nucleotidyltransferase family protein [Clostridia bacterium]
MKICAIITEYNPFHKGHFEQIEFLKNNYSDICVVSIMSGNIVQRGELAVLEKYKRAEAAVKMGADIVLELPYPYSCSSAGYFAGAGVFLADSIGADMLCFGSECGDLGLLYKVAKRTLDDEYIFRLQELVQGGKNTSESYISLYRRAYSELYGEEIPEGANNTLAIEYLRALIALDSRIVPITNKRTSPYSASATRYFYRRGEKEMFSYLPEALFEFYSSNKPCTSQDAAKVILWHLANADSMELSQFADVDQGLASRLISCAQESADLAEFFSKAATKKYTDSRVRRAVFNCLLGVKKDMLEAPPLYTLLLAASSLGCRTLKEIKKNSRVEIITKPAGYKELNKDVQNAFLLSCKADALFFTATGEKIGDILRRSPVILP